MWTVAPLRDGKPNSGHYGFGWFIEGEEGTSAHRARRAWQGFETQISRYVDDRLTVVVLTNLEGAKPGPDRPWRRQPLFKEGRTVDPSDGESSGATPKAGAPRH